VAFFQKVRLVFQISKSQQKNIPKNYPELEHFTVIGGKFKYQAQDSFLEYFFVEIWRSEKISSHFLKKKPPLPKDIVITYK
jgi:hypothetical protein